MTKQAAGAERVPGRGVPGAGVPGGGVPGLSELGRHWGALEAGTLLLNHGSFGACPLHLLERAQEYRLRMEAEPVRFFVEELEAGMDAARRAAAGLLGCDADDLALVTNASMAVSTVVRSLALRPGDELVTSAHEYNACNNALRLVERTTGAKVVQAELPWPVESPEQVTRAIVGAVTERTKLVLVSHVTSPTAVVLPVGEIVRELNARGIDTLVDGAHAPGMIPLDLTGLNAAYYTGNFHKWCCTPKGCAFLHVRKDRQGLIHPLTISHGSNSARTDRSRFRLEFDYTGTADYSAFLVLAEALEFLGTLRGGGGGGGGGMDGYMRSNRALALEGRSIIASAVSAGMGRRVEDVIPVPGSMIGSIAAVLLPDMGEEDAGLLTKYHDPLQDRLLERYRVQVPIVNFPGRPRRLVRISAQAYNTVEHYHYLARALQDLLF